MDKFYSMNVRMAEELEALGISNSEAARRLGCNKTLISQWIRGTNHPSAYYLARLYDLGCDIVYILTGVRTRGGDTSV